MKKSVFLLLSLFLSFVACAQKGGSDKKKIVRLKEKEATTSSASGHLIITLEVEKFGRMGIYANGTNGYNCPEDAFSWNCYQGEVEVELGASVESTQLCLELGSGGSYDRNIEKGQWKVGILDMSVQIEGKTYQLRGSVVGTRGHETEGRMNITSCQKKP